MRKFIAPVDDEFGDLDPGTRRDADEETGIGDDWEKLADKYEELGEKVRNYIEEENIRESENRQWYPRQSR